MRSKGGKEAKTRKTLGQRKEEWLKPQIAGALQEKTKTFPQAPWETTSDTPAPSRRKASERQAAEEENQGNQENQEEARQIRPKTRKSMIKERAEEEWKKRWQKGSKGRELYKLIPEPMEGNRHLYAGRTKAHSALLIQLRTGKIGFSNFLFERRVPGVWSRRCACDEGAMTVRHVLLRCPTWRVIREEELGGFQGNIKRILNSSPGATAAIRLILKTKLLDQFKATACESHAENRRSEDEGRRGSKSRSSG
jgi:hypothetical protein